MFYYHLRNFNEHHKKKLAEHDISTPGLWQANLPSLFSIFQIDNIVLQFLYKYEITFETTSKETLKSILANYSFASFYSKSENI